MIEPVHQLDQSLDEVIRDPRIIEPVCTILGTDALALWTNKLNLKRGGSGSGFGWHQDSPYWVHDSDHVDLLPNVYLAFDDATEANGCLRVIDRSHLQGCLPGCDDGTQLGGFFTDPNHFSEADQVLLEVPAGSLVFFDPHCIHGSRPNATDLPRRAPGHNLSAGWLPHAENRGSGQCNQSLLEKVGRKKEWIEEGAGRGKGKWKKEWIEEGVGRRKGKWKKERIEEGAGRGKGKWKKEWTGFECAKRSTRRDDRLFNQESDAVSSAALNTCSLMLPAGQYQPRLLARRPAVLQQGCKWRGASALCNIVGV